MNAEDQSNITEETKATPIGEIQSFLKSVGIQANALGNNASGVEMLSINAKDIELAASKLKKDQAYTSLSFLTALEVKSGYQVIYQFEKQALNQAVQIKVTVDKSAPNIPSLHKVYAAADWQEREAFDMIGVHFEGHPNLVRILNPDKWEGHPLRKDYIGPVDELNQPMSYSA